MSYKFHPYIQIQYGLCPCITFVVVCVGLNCLHSVNSTWLAYSSKNPCWAATTRIIKLVIPCILILRIIKNSQNENFKYVTVCSSAVKKGLCLLSGFFICLQITYYEF
jgi:hypothetical protein